MRSSQNAGSRQPSHPGIRDECGWLALMETRSMSGVDYEQTETARRYSKGRGLPDEVLDRWQAAVTPHLPDRVGLEVLDLGAGTGIFTRAWPTWLPCDVIAVEPAAAMRTEMIEDGIPAAVRVIAGRAEQLPLKSASIDVAWLSAVIHHFDDLDRCAAEIHRVLTVDGTVLVRGLFADLGTTPALELVPGFERAVAAFPAVATIEQAFTLHGLRLTSADTVDDTGPATLGQVSDRIRRLRSADSLLKQFTDDELAEGLAAIDAMDASQPLPPASLGLLVFRS